MRETAISVRDLVKKYGEVRAVNRISFEVRRGEVFGLLGPNGAGKTTTLECLEGMREADGGSLAVDGCDPQREKRKLRKVLGVQLQASSLPEAILPEEAMELICSWHGIPARRDILTRFGMDGEKKKQYKELSTGQKRRLNLALALAGDPTVLILDEPTAGLDVQGRAQLHEAIRELRESGVSVLLATHDMAEAESLCDRIAILIKGKIAVTGTPAEITSAGSTDTQIMLRTGKNTLLPGRDIEQTRFIKQNGDYTIWSCRDAASGVMELLRLVQKNGDTVEDLRVEKPTLEERFLQLIREEAAI